MIETSLSYRFLLLEFRNKNASDVLHREGGKERFGPYITNRATRLRINQEVVGHEQERGLPIGEVLI